MQVGYIDSSVLLRLLLKEPGKMLALDGFERLISSELLRVECLRVLYRYRLTGQFSDDRLAEHITLFHQLLDEISIIPLSPLVIQRACLPSPTVLGTLDAIHFVTAQLWQENQNQGLVLLTHDVQLQTAGRSVGMKIG